MPLPALQRIAGFHVPSPADRSDRGAVGEWWRWRLGLDEIMGPAMPMAPGTGVTKLATAQEVVGGAGIEPATPAV